MALGPNTDARMRPYSRTDAYAADYDAGLRAYMLRVYNYMASGLLLTGIVAYFTATTPEIMQMFYTASPRGALQPTMLAYVVMFAPLVFIMVLSFGIHRMQASTAQALFWAFAVVMGLSSAHIFLMYTGTSVARVFFISAATFGAMSLYGYTTKRDLSQFGSFLVMGLIGIMVASLVNIFLASTALQFAISIIGVLVFVGLAAHDTQAIKLIYAEADSADTMTKKAVMGALSLYLDFLNLFMLLLQLFGDRR